MTINIIDIIIIHKKEKKIFGLSMSEFPLFCIIIQLLLLKKSLVIKNQHRVKNNHN